MDFSSIKLSTKGLLLVFSLLLCELLFVGCHTWLLTRAEAEAARQQTTREIIGRADRLMHALFTVGDSCARYVFNGDKTLEQKYQDARNEIGNHITWIKHNVDNDPAQSALIEKIEGRVALALSMLAEMKKTSDHEAQIVAMQYAVRARAKLQTEMEGLVLDLRQFTDSEKKIESASPAVMRAQREQMKWLLLAGLALNILAAVALALFFVRGVTGRLSIVLENSQRLRQRQKLRAPLTGGDEIAELDLAFHDMSSSLRGEEALVLSSQEQLKAIVEQMPIGLVIIDEAQKIEYANPTIQNVLGYSGDVGGGLIGSKLVSHFDQARIKTGVSIADAEAMLGVQELTAYGRDGREIPVEYSITDVSLGNLSRQLATILDVSEKHEMEKMRQAFVAMVSHDLRTPLTSVGGFLQMLPMGAYGKISGPATAETSVAEGHVEQLVMLINDLLDLEKLQAGQLQMTGASTALEDIIDSAVENVYSDAETYDISVIFEGCEIAIVTDKDRLTQAITKMLVCLLRLCPGRDTINVAVTTAGKEIQIALKTGKLQLPQEQMQTIFEPFQQFDLPTAKGGLGLMLPLARSIVNQLGGQCGVESEKNSLYLWIRLPMMILLFFIFVFVQPAFANGSEPGWILEQLSSSVGQQTVYCTSKAVKAVNRGQGVVTIARAPDWQIYIFNDTKKAYFQSPLKDWKGPPIQTLMMMYGLDASHFTLRKIGDGIVAGHKAICYQPEILTVHKPSVSEAVFHDDQVNAGRCKEFWVSDEIKVPPQLVEALCKIYTVTPIGRVPLRLIYMQNGKKTNGLETLKCRPQVISDSAFDLPVGYKKVRTNSDVLQDD